MKENSINEKEVDNRIKISIPIISNQEIENIINTEDLYDKIAEQIYHDREMIILQEFIKKLQKENEELKEERQIVGIPVRNKRDGRIGIVLHQWESGNVAVLESINPRVINTHDSWNTLEIVTDEVKQTQTKCETIPVQKIKDKIEEITQKIKYEENEKVLIQLHKQRKVLQELIKKEE